MLYVFFGNDTIGVREKAHNFVGGQEKSGMKIERIDSDNYASGILSDIAGAVSLFGDETLYIIDTPSTSKEMYEDVLEHLVLFQESPNTIVIIEGSLLAAQKKKFEKYAESIEEIKGEKNERFNAFGMSDALLRRDKKSLWLLLQEAKTAGLSPEEIIGTLWWQLKSLRLAKVTNSPEEAGLKPFVYEKAKRALGRFKEGELEKISRDLFTVYHDGHLGKKDIELALEKWTLMI